MPSAGWIVVVAVRPRVTSSTYMRPVGFSMRMRIVVHLAWVVNRHVLFIHLPVFTGPVRVMSLEGYAVTSCVIRTLAVMPAAARVCMVSWYWVPPVTVTGS